MDISRMQNRVYYLMGAVDEAKRIYQEALGEVNEVNKKQTNSAADPDSSRKDLVVSERVNPSISAT